MDPFASVDFDSSEEFLPTYIDKIDNVLGGGIPLGKVTEIHGQSGVGKTQFCLQLCSNVRLPKSIGGLEGQSLFLDCSGGFSVKRLGEICNATQQIAAQSLPEQEKLKFENLNFLDSIHYKRIDSYEQLSLSLDELVTTILPNANIKLIVIDSIAFHFRYPILDGIANIHSSLHAIAQKLNAIAYNWKTAVIVTNQMTTRILQANGDNSGEGEIIPALGESWSHACSTSICLELKEDIKDMETEMPFKKLSRVLKIVKSPIVRNIVDVIYEVTASGIREVQE